jgi:hypothetical protein
VLRWAGHVVSIGEMRNAYDILVRKQERENLENTEGKMER